MPRSYLEYWRRREMRLYIAAQAEAATAFYTARAVRVGSGIALAHAQEAGEQAAQDAINAPSPLKRAH